MRHNIYIGNSTIRKFFYNDVLLDLYIQESNSKPTTDIVLELSILSGQIGQCKQIFAKAKPYSFNEDDLSWLSSNENIVTVNKRGIINFVSEGNAEITITSKNNPFISRKVQIVSDKKIDTLSPTKDQLLIWLDGRDGNNLDKTTLWNDKSSNNHNFALENFEFSNRSGWSGSDLYNFSGTGKCVCNTNSLSFNENTFSIEAYLYQTGGAQRLLKTNEHEISISNHSANFTRKGVSTTSSLCKTQVGKKEHIVITCNDQEIKFYQNGELKDTLINSGAKTSILNNFILFNQTNGGIISYRVYNKVLSLSEVLDNYQYEMSITRDDKRPKDVFVEDINLTKSITGYPGDIIDLSYLELAPNDCTFKNCIGVSWNKQIAFFDSNKKTLTLKEPGNTKLQFIADDSYGFTKTFNVEVKNNESIPEYECYPHLSTQYFKPKVFNDEHAIIPIYVTDGKQNEYLNKSMPLSFTLRIEIDGHVSTQPVKYGDNIIDLGIIEGNGEHWFSLQVIDNLGYESQCLYNEILVVDKETYPITPAQTYMISDADLATYNIIKNPVDDLTEEQRILTKIGFTTIFDTLQKQGYKKCVVPKGIYKITYSPDRAAIGNDINKKPIMIPSHFTIDFNHSTVKLVHNLETYNVNVIFLMQGCQDSHVMNCICEGDYQEAIASGAPISGGQPGEGGGCIVNYGGKHCSWSNLEVHNFSGYSQSALYGHTVPTFDATHSSWMPAPIVKDVPYSLEEIKIFKDGYKIDPATGLEIVDNNRTISPWLTLDNKALSYGFVCFSVWLALGGYKGGNPHLDVSFYDENKKYISTIRGFQYRYMRCPKASRYVRYSGWGIGTNYNGLGMHTAPGPRYCSVTDSHWHDNATCMAPAQFNNLLFKNIKFSRSGYRITASCIDIEDGWEASTDFYMTGCEVLESIGTRDFIGVSGQNYVLENNKNFCIDLRDRIRGMTVRNNKKCALYINVGFWAGRCSRFYNNEITYIANSSTRRFDQPILFTQNTTDDITKGTRVASNMNAPVRFENNTFTLTGFENAIMQNSTLSMPIQAYYGAPCECRNCIFTDSINISMNQIKHFLHHSCTYLEDATFRQHNYFSSIQLHYCTFEKNLNLHSIGTRNRKNEITIRNCTIKGNLSLSFSSNFEDGFITFIDCNILGEISYNNSLIVENHTTFVNCTHKGVALDKPFIE